MAKKITTRRVILTALLVDVVDIITNFIVAVISGSAVMLVEMIAGVADLLSMLLLLIGNKRSQRLANKLHPFGHGKEQYFWATLAGFIILAITANLSFIFGWHALQHPEEISYIGLTYAVLGLAVVTNGYAFRQAAHKLLQDRPWRQLPKVFMQSWDIGSKTALVLDCMGAVAGLIGLVSLVLYGLTGQSKLDGLGAVLMAITLALFAILLLVGTKSLVTGQSTAPEAQAKIRRAALSVPQVREVVRLRTMVLGSEDLLVNLEVHMQNNLTTDDIEQAADKVVHAVQRAMPDERVFAAVQPVDSKDR